MRKLIEPDTRLKSTRSTNFQTPNYSNYIIMVVSLLLLRYVFKDDHLTANTLAIVTIVCIYTTTYIRSFNQFKTNTT